MIGDKATKRHRDRKSEGSAEVWRKRKKALNAARHKQVYDDLTKTWVRIDPEWAKKWVEKGLIG